jgi:hypothetical protein
MSILKRIREIRAIIENEGCEQVECRQRQKSLHFVVRAPEGHYFGLNASITPRSRSGALDQIRGDIRHQRRGSLP